MNIEPDAAVATDGNFEIDDTFNRDGYLHVAAGAYAGYVMLNRAQVEQTIAHLAKVLGRDVSA